MPTDPTGYAGPHPDLRALVCDAIHQMGERQEGADPSAMYAPAGLTPDRLTVRCQRTWRNIHSRNEELNGRDLSAVLVQFAADGRHYSYFMQAARPFGGTDWQPGMMQGGELPAAVRDRAGGFLILHGLYVCVGGLMGDKRVAAMQVEHADGTTYTEPLGPDVCCIVFAPVVKTLAWDDRFTLRHLDARNRELYSSRTWIGDGGPPPPHMRRRKDE